MLSHRQTKGGHGQLGAEGLDKATPHTFFQPMAGSHSSRSSGSALRATGASSGAEMVTQADHRPALPPTMSPGHVPSHPCQTVTTCSQEPQRPCAHFLPAALCKGDSPCPHSFQILRRVVLPPCPPQPALLWREGYL